MSGNPGAGSDTASSVHSVGEHSGGGDFSTMGVKKMLKNIVRKGKGKMLKRKKRSRGKILNK